MTDQTTQDPLAALGNLLHFDPSNLPKIDLSKLPNPTQLENVVMSIDAVVAPFAALPGTAGAVAKGVAAFGSVLKMILDAEMQIQQVTGGQAGAPGADPLRQILWQLVGGLLHAQSSAPLPSPDLAPAPSPLPPLPLPSPGGQSDPVRQLLQQLASSFHQAANA